jgi:hypothetical protein
MPNRASPSSAPAESVEAAAARPAQGRRQDDPIAHAFVRAQVSLATANAILLAMVCAFEGAPDSAVPEYVRDARVHLSGPDLA